MSIFFSETKKSNEKIQNCFEFRFVLRLDSCPLRKKEAEYVILLFLFSCTYKVEWIPVWDCKCLKQNDEGLLLYFVLINLDPWDIS